MYNLNRAEFYKGFNICERKQSLEQMGDKQMFSKVIGYDAFISGVSTPVLFSKRKRVLKAFCKTTTPREMRTWFNIHHTIKTL